MARLFLEVLFHYRQQGKYLLHEFVVMPDHFHLLINPAVTLERALQLIKGGFSYRARKELGVGCEVWQASFYDRRGGGGDEDCAFRGYICLDSVKKKVVGVGAEYPLSFPLPGVWVGGVPHRREAGRVCG